MQRSIRRIAFERAEDGNCIARYYRSPEERIHFLEKMRDNEEAAESISSFLKTTVTAKPESALQYILQECRRDRNILEIEMPLDAGLSENIKASFEAYSQEFGVPIKYIS